MAAADDLLPAIDHCVKQYLDLCALHFVFRVQSNNIVLGDFRRGHFRSYVRMWIDCAEEDVDVIPAAGIRTHRTVWDRTGNRLLFPSSFI